jgi:hypothetical protein
MDDLERDLATRLHQRSAHVTPGEDLPARIRARVYRRQRQRRFLLTAVPTVCLLVAALTLIAVVAANRTHSPQSASAAPSVPSTTSPTGRTPAGSLKPPTQASGGLSSGTQAAGPTMAGNAPDDGSVASTRWIPVAYGDAQVSVPPGTVTASTPCPDPRAYVTVYLGPRPQGIYNCPLEPTGVTTVTLEALPAGASTSGVAPVTVHGIKVFPSSGNSSAVVTGLVPSLAVQVQVEGPLSSRILGTLARSPLSTVLARGRVPRTPRSWQRLTFGGLSVGAPAHWPVQHVSDWEVPCGAEPPWEMQPLIGVGSQPSVTLDAGADTSLEPKCPAATTGYLPAQPPTDGLIVDPGPVGPLASITSYEPCLSIAGLRVCPAQNDGRYGELVLRVTTSSGTTDAVVIGLSGNGSTARRILYSLRPA